MCHICPCTCLLVYMHVHMWQALSIKQRVCLLTCYMYTTCYEYLITHEHNTHVCTYAHTWHVLYMYIMCALHLLICCSYVQYHTCMCLLALAHYVYTKHVCHQHMSVHMQHVCTDTCTFTRVMYCVCMHVPIWSVLCI